MPHKDDSINFQTLIFNQEVEMTTLQRNIRMDIRAVLAGYGIDNLKMEIDLAEVIRPFVEAGKRNIEGKRGDMIDLILDPETKKKLQMRVRVENSLRRNLNWDDLKQDWNTFDRWLLDTESESGETIEKFMTWYNSDSFRAKGVIYLTAQKIKDWWLQAFDEKQEYHTRGEQHAL
jgi:hypothetical protein